MFFLLSVFFIAAIFLEGSVTVLPLVLICLLGLTIFKRKAVVFLIAFLVGIILDILIVRVLGSTSIFFLIFIFLILLYQRKYEINSYPFVAVATFLGSLVFLFVFNRGNLFLDPVFSAVIALVFFALLRFIDKKS